ncbi:MAG: hypothetical protein ABIR63_09020 [Sphingomicrobium sp.]
MADYTHTLVRSGMGERIARIEARIPRLDREALKPSMGAISASTKAHDRETIVAALSVRLH